MTTMRTRQHGVQQSPAAAEAGDRPHALAVALGVVAVLGLAVDI